MQLYVVENVWNPASLHLQSFQLHGTVGQSVSVLTCLSLLQESSALLENEARVRLTFYPQLPLL